MGRDTVLAGLPGILARAAAFHVLPVARSRTSSHEACAAPSRRAFAPVRSRDEDLHALMEFVPGNDAATVGREARGLHYLLAVGCLG
jgi:hypothetical protein